MIIISAAKTNGQVLISLIFGDALNSGKVEFGLEGGLNWANIKGFESESYLRNYNLGFYFDIKLNSPWYIYTGVLVKSNLGTDKLTGNDIELLRLRNYEENGDYSQVTKTFQVPILIKYRFNNNFFLLAGMQSGLLYNAWIEFNKKTDAEEIRKKFYNKSEFNVLDFGFMAGFGYKIKEKNDHGISFSFRYYLGLVDIYKNIDGAKNNSFFLDMTIPVGAD